MTTVRSFSAPEYGYRFMSIECLQIHVAPWIPNTCLDCLAGWLLRGKLETASEILDGVARTLFFAADDEIVGRDIDADFLRLFRSTPNDDPLKRALVQENDYLATEDGLTIGRFVATCGVEIEDVLQRIVAERPDLLPAIELTFCNADGMEQRDTADCWCSLITPTGSISFSFDDWFSEQRALLGLEALR